MQENYKINDYLKEDNKNYCWYKDIINGKMPRYKMDKSRPYDDANYYWANSFDKNNWYIHFGNTYNMKNPIAIIKGIKKTNKALIELWKMFKDLQDDDNYDTDDTNKLYDILDMFDNFKVVEKEQ